jgi:hypothetical protein
MTCELWVRGRAESGGPIDVDVPVKGWIQGAALPSLTVINSGNYSAGVVTFYSMSGGWQYDPAGWYSYPDLYLKGDCVGGLDPNVRHDCLNGGCISKVTYNTPGKYPNLAACQAACAKDSNCDGECVSAAEIAALQQAANLVKTKLCG